MAQNEPHTLVSQLVAPGGAGSSKWPTVGRQQLCRYKQFVKLHWRKATTYG